MHVHVIPCAQVRRDRCLSRDRSSDQSRDRRDRRNSSYDRRERQDKTPHHVRVQAQLARLRAARDEIQRVEKFELAGEIAYAACKASHM